MILKSSTDPKEWAEALRWSKAAVDSDPNNVDYKATYTALQAKIQAK
jgi:hypothetical protein